jgi:hypothetical protein
MSNVRAYIIYANPESKNWESVVDFGIEPPAKPNWDSAAIDLAALKPKWNAVTLPNGEALDVHLIVNAETRQCTTINVRQGTEPVAQVLCERLSSVIFRTLAGASVNVQVRYDS